MDLSDFKFQINDTEQARVKKLEYLRASAAFTTYTAANSDWAYVLSDILQKAGKLLPAPLPLMTRGKTVEVTGEGAVFQYDGQVVIGTRDWLPVLVDKNFTAGYRVRAIKDPALGATVPEFGFLIYNAAGEYVGQHLVTFGDAPMTVASGWHSYKANTTSAAIRTEYPTAAYVRSYFYTGERRGTYQIANASVGNATDIDGIEEAVALAEAAAAAAVAAALAGAGSAETAAGYAEDSEAWASVATGEAGASQASAVAAQSFADQSEDFATASSSSADVALTKAGEAGASASAAHVDRLAAEAANSGALAQAGIATTKAAAASASAAAALSSETLSATYAGMATAAIAKTWPFSLNPDDRDAYELPGIATVIGPNLGWPTPYITNSNAGQGAANQYLRFRKMRARPEPGRKYRVTAWAYSYTSNNVNFNLWVLSSATGVWDGSAIGHSATVGSPVAVNGFGVGSGFVKLVAEFTVDTGWKGYWTPIFEGNFSGVPDNTWHMTPMLVEDITDISVTNANVTTAANAAASATLAVASLTTETRASYGAGGNLLDNSKFAVDLAGVSFYAANPSAYESNYMLRNGAGDTWRPWQENNVSLHQIDASASPAQVHWFLSATAGQWYEWSIYSAAHRAQTGLRFEWYDAANSLLGATYYSGPGNGDGNGATVDTGGTDINRWTRRWLKAQAPAGTSRMVVVAFKNQTNPGEGDSWAWWVRPMVREVTATTQGPTLYVPAADTASVKVQSQSTADNTGKLRAYWGVIASVPGSRATLSVYADNAGAGVDIIGDLRIRNASGSQNIDLTNGTIVFNNGSVMKVVGTGFGSANQFVEWFGPALGGLNLCTEANAISYAKTNGSAYFGGTLSAGTLKNAVQTTSVAADAAVGTGTVGSNGGSRNVVVSYNWNRDRNYNGPMSAGSGAISAVIHLYRNGAYWVALNASGTWIRESAAGSFEPGGYQEAMSGSLTVTDSAGGANVSYDAYLVSRTLGPGGSGSLNSNTSAQRIGIVQTEG